LPGFEASWPVVQRSVPFKEDIDLLPDLEPVISLSVELNHKVTCLVSEQLEGGVCDVEASKLRVDNTIEAGRPKDACITWESEKMSAVELF